MREFLHVDDMAAASIHVMELAREVWQENTAPMLSHINVGTGVDCTIRGWRETIAKGGGLRGRVVFDAAKPDGTPRVNCSTSRACISLAAVCHGFTGGRAAGTYQWFLENRVTVPGQCFYVRKISRRGVADHALISLDFIVEGKLAGRRTGASVSTVRRRATGFVPGAGVQRRNAGDRLCTRLTPGGTGRASAAPAAGTFYGVCSTSMTTAFSGEDFQLTTC